MEDRSPEELAFKFLIVHGTEQKLPPEMVNHVMKAALAIYATQAIQTSDLYRTRTFFELDCWWQIKDTANKLGFFPETGLEAWNGNVEVPEAVFELFMETVGDVMKYWPLIAEVANRLINKSVIEGQELEDLIKDLFKKLDLFERMDTSNWSPWLRHVFN